MPEARPTASADRVRAAAAAMAAEPGSRAGRNELFHAIRESIGDDLARWSRKLATPMDSVECASVLWEQLLERPVDLSMLATATRPVAWLWKAAAHEPTAGVQRPNGWLFDYAGGYARTGAASILDWDGMASDVALVATGMSEACGDGKAEGGGDLTAIQAVIQRILDVLLCRTPEHLHAPVTEAVEWMAVRRIQWRNATAYVSDASAAVPGLTEEQVRTVLAVVWGSSKRKDMSLFNLFRLDGTANIVDHGPVYRSASLYMARMHGWKKRTDSRQRTA